MSLVRNSKYSLEAFIFPLKTVSYTFFNSGNSLTSSKDTQLTNQLTLSFHRPLQILDMPDEILMEIFSYLKSDNEPGICSYQHSRPTIVPVITQLRLTCRRFCATSSHLLLPYLSVECNSSSLAHFEEVSHHKTIRQSVQTVEISLDSYDSLLANNLLEFARYFAQNLQMFRRSVLTCDSRLSQQRQISLSRLAEKLRKAHEMEYSWLRYADGTPADFDSDEDMAFHLLLRKGHEEYRKRFQDQMAVLADGNFAQTVAAAMARMPLVKSLVIRDGRRYTSKGIRLFCWEENENARNEILASDILSVPNEWKNHSIDSSGHSSLKSLVSMMVEIPRAIHMARISLTGLKVEISIPNDISGFGLSQEAQHDLKAAMQKLKKFEFKVRPSGQGGSIGRPHLQKSEIMCLDKFVESLLDTESIEKIKLDFRYLWARASLDSQKSSLGSILTGRRWSNLYSLRCDSLSLQLHELELFLDSLDHRLEFFHTENLRLVSGTWAQALDILREKHGRFMTLQNPSGAECEFMTNEEKNDIFRAMGIGKAQRYIRGVEKQNPLREPPAEETS